MEHLPEPPTAAPLPLPLPLPLPAAPIEPTRPVARAGQLTTGWSTVFWLGWLLIAASFVAIWYSSRLLGLATWWLGPSTEPQFFLVNLLPFVPPLSLAAAAVMRKRHLPWWGLGSSLFLAGVAAFDISDVPGYAVIEFGLATAGLFLSLASFAGMYRAAEPTTTDSTTTENAAVENAAVENAAVENAAVEGAAVEGAAVEAPPA